MEHAMREFAKDARILQHGVVLSPSAPPLVSEKVICKSAPKCNPASEVLQTRCEDTNLNERMLGMG